ncbi:MAG: flagellar basal body rod C-terminal domain-containing protein, partial [Patescibacteria group bacterium]|nr:flagellar basal body rod C-terminal domain-containing protein [Patescibacteria group bacterium]
SNPTQVGRGVRVVGNVTDFSQGAIELNASPDAGLAITGSPDQGGFGSLYSGAVEMSNTDLGGNQIDLILATNQFRANMQVVRTADDLLGELITLRRS